MKTYRNIAATGIVLFGLGGTWASAQNANTRNVDQYSCKDIMREHGDNRDVTIAFLHGFLLGKSGSSNFDTDVLHKQTGAFIEYCLDHPGEKAMDAMAKIKG